MVSGGRGYPGCVAILLQHAAHNVVAHNEVCDFYYSAVSVGWVWDYHPSVSVGNVVEGNHLHHLGQGELNDMGGVYLLGIAPGTVVRRNHIHDVRCRNYGGWGSTWTRPPRTSSSRPTPSTTPPATVCTCTTAGRTSRATTCWRSAARAR